MEPWVTVLVLNWNGKADTLACLESLSNLTYARRDTVVVDNGSSDGSAGEIARTFPDVTVLETGANLGFTGGNNIGLKHVLGTSADCVLILNNDTQVDPDFLGRLVQDLHSHGSRTILGAITLSNEHRDRVLFGGGFWDPGTLHFRWLQETIDSKLYAAETLETDYIQGSAMLIPTPALRDVGLLDDRYFLTYEDTDWCYRARKLGYRILLSTRARVWHKESPSFGGKRGPLYVYFVTRNRLLWTQTHMGWREVAKVARRLYWGLLSDLRDHRLSESGRSGLRWRPIRDSLAFARRPETGRRSYRDAGLPIPPIR